MSGKNVSYIKQHRGTVTLKVKKKTYNASNTNFIKKCDTEGNDLNQYPFTFPPYFGLYLPILSVDFLEAYEEFKDP